MHGTKDPVVGSSICGGAEKKQTIEERFLDFHTRNPQIYDELCRLARVWQKRHGERRLGIKMLWEVMRWNIYVEATPNEPDDYKLNNDYTSRYARLIMAQESDLADVFEIRARRAA